MPIPENAVPVLIPCQSCPREHFLYLDPDTGEVLAYDGARAPVGDGESLPAAFYRLLNARCVECQRVWDLDRDFITRRLADLGAAAYDDPDHVTDAGPLQAD